MLVRLSTALALLPHVARAQEPPSVSAEGKPIEQIVVRSSSSVALELFQDVAGIESISDEEIDVIPATDASQVIEHLAGIRTQQRIQGEEAAVSIEGMPPEYSLLLVDGQRWSGEIGGVGDASDIPLQNVEQIDILRGGQGARYGADAGGGVIDVVTHGAPDEGYLLSADGAGGSDYKALGGGTGAMRLGPVGLSLSGQYDAIDGFDVPSDPDIVSSQIGDEDSRHHQYFTYAKWDAPVSNAITLRGNGLWRVEDDVFVPEEDLYRTDTNWRVNLGGDWAALTSTDVSADLNYYAIETESRVGREFVLDEDETAAVVGGEQWFETGPVSHTLFGGVEALYQRLRLREGALPPTVENPELEANRRQKEHFGVPSIYLRNESDLTSWLTLELGARARFHSEFDTRVLPSVGVLITPIDDLRLRASWGLSYRTPSLRDLFQPPTPQLGGAYFLSGNPDLEPENSSSVRASFEWTPARWLRLAGAGFYNDIDDHIRSRQAGSIVIGSETRLVDPVFSPELIAICEAQAEFFPDPDDWTPECRAYFSGEPVEQTFEIRSQVFEKANLDSVQTYGIEVQLRLQPSPYASLALDYTWLRTHVSDPSIDIDELPNEAAHSASLRAALTSPWTDTEMSSALRFRTGVIPERSGTGLLTFADASARTDASYQLDLRIAQPIAQPWFGSLRLYVDALNVTDERREDSYAIRGRSFVAGISGEFESAL